MTKHNINRVLLIYNILMSASIIIAGICLIWGCLSIYYSGDDYSRELVAYTFSKINVPIYVCLGLIFGSLIINLIIPSPQIRKPIKHYNKMLLNLTNTHDANANAEYVKNEKTKKYLNSINFLCVFVFGGAFLIYALNGNNFHQSDINASMIKAMWILLPCIIVPFAFSVFTHYYSISLTKKQIEILKTLPTKEKATDTAEIKSDGKKILITKIVIATVAVAILIFGAVTGGFADVLTKAVNICTECIGLG